jgi:hypothetical protein
MAALVVHLGAALVLGELGGAEVEWGLHGRGVILIINYYFVLDYMPK